MGLNIDKPNKWKSDIKKSVDMYNNWFLNFAPEAFRITRKKTILEVTDALSKTDYFKNIAPVVLIQYPEILATLRMATCPPIAVDRLIGLAGVNSNLVKKIEHDKKLPIRLTSDKLNVELIKICEVINKLLDKDIFPWLENMAVPGDDEIGRASTIVADRLCGAVTNPVIRNTQEKRQLEAIRQWLEKSGYRYMPDNQNKSLTDLAPGTFAVHFNVPVKMNTQNGFVNIPVDVVIIPSASSPRKNPLLIEAKSAGDFTNVNKRRKEEAQKMTQLKNTYGDSIDFVLFLCGYFDSGYLGYEAAEGIDWIWEHSIDDFNYFLRETD